MFMACKDLSKTPTKVSKVVNISPVSKGSICVICGKSIVNISYRRKLFLGSKKTENCLLIESSLNVSIYRECSSHIACRRCLEKVTQASKDIQQLQLSFRSTITSLYDSHGKEVVKRLRPPEETETKESRRKSLFVSDTQVQQYKSSDYSEVICDIDQTSSCITVTIQGPDGIQRPIVQSLTPLGLALTNSNFRNLSSIILKTEILNEYLLEGICHQLQDEVTKLCSHREKSILRNRTSTDLLNISWEDIANEWKITCPTYWSFLQVFISNPSIKRNKHKTCDSLLSGLVSAGCKLLHIYNRELNAVQQLNSIILLKGGAKKSLFNRLNVTKDCISYNAAVNVVEQFSKEWLTNISRWKYSCEVDSKTEKDITDNVLRLQEVVTNHGATLESLVLLDEEEKILQTHRQHMHPGYYFVGDNVDFYIKVRHMTTSNQNKSQHMFQMCAYLNRVSGNTFDDSKPKMEAMKAPFSTFVPNTNDQSQIVQEMALLVAQQWTKYIPCFTKFTSVLPNHICHKYMSEMRQKTERINLGVLDKNEQYNDQMTDICEFLHTLVPGHDTSPDWTKSPSKVLSGGDYLTFERHKQAQTGKANGRTPSKRLEGLVPKMEEFHNQAEFLKIIWRLLYKTTSSSEIGTLFAARNKINARNVPTDPHENYYASSNFMDKVTTAYIIAGGLHHFNMLDINSEPQPEYTGIIGDGTKMKEYIMKHAVEFVAMYCSPDIPLLPEYGPQSNEGLCRYCGQAYTKLKCLRKHEANIHSHQDPQYNPGHENDRSDSKDKDMKSTSVDYSKLCLTLGLLRLIHNDAIAMGDGKRMLRMVKFFWMYYKATNCTKYAYGLLETVAQAEILLSERQAERLVWNRTVNHQGRKDTNHPNDLDLEHCNKVFKDEVHTYRGKYTERTMLRVSRSSSTTEKICKKYDRFSNVRQSSGKHTSADVSNDILSLVDQFHCVGRVYDDDVTKHHAHFPDVRDPLQSLNMEHIQDWISKSLVTFANKTFYVK